MSEIVRLPLDAIDEGALPRDRTGLDAQALAELQTSILMTGLRQPIEVFAMQPHPDEPPDAPPRYGLISGFRRLAVFRSLAPDPRYAEIPAFVRQPRDIPEALSDMVAENEIRADLSPWEKGRIVGGGEGPGLVPHARRGGDQALPGARPPQARPHPRRRRGGGRARRRHPRRA